MWEYKKYLEYPVNITKPDLKYRKLLINAIGGYAGELAAAGFSTVVYTNNEP